MSVSNVSAASSNQSITPPHNTPGYGSAAAAAIAATALAPSVADAPLPSPATCSSFLVSTETPIESLPNEMTLKIFLKFPVKEIARIRRVNSCFRDIGGEALAKKISDERIPLAKLGLRENVKVLAFLESLSPANRSIIKMLDLSRTEVGNSFLARLSSLTPNLQGLNLEGCSRFTDDGLNFLTFLPDLENLRLRSCCQIAGRNPQNLALLTQLRNLDLAYCNLIDDNNIHHLASLSRLRILSLSSCICINDLGLQRLAPLTELRNLNLDELSGITNDGLKNLIPFTKLENLSLMGCLQITDDGLQNLTSLRRLQRLNLAGCGFTNSIAFKSLNPEMHSRILEERGCDQITERAKSELKSSIPGLTIIS